MTQLEQLRQIERDKYKRVAYNLDHYRMGDRRKAEAEADLTAIPCRTSYLDVSCGRGELLDLAENLLGFDRVQGTEIVDVLLNERVLYADAWALPFADGEFDVVSCMDVIEHILPQDEQRTLMELNRVSGKYVLMTANNKPSRSLGVELHVNRKPYYQWDASIKAAFPGCDVRWLRPGQGFSETWLICK